ncbi:modifier protein of major autolysin LytC, partial [Listeria grandensis FSL F6-0971]
HQKTDSTQVASGIVAANGTYAITIPKQAYGSTVTATVTLNGQTSSASTLVTQGTIAQTTINSLTSDQTSVSGRGESGGTVVIKNGTTQVASGTVATNGTYTITVPKQAYGSIVTATVTKNGKTSSASTLVTQGTIAQTTINSLTSDHTSVSGKGEPGGTIVIKNGTTQVASGTVAANGTYTITVPKQAYGSTVTATVTLNGQTSSASTVVTQETIAQTTINSLTSDQTSVSGRGEPGGTVVIKNGTTQVASGTVAANGTYTITVPKQAYGSGSIVSATVTKNGQTSSASTVVTQGAIAQTTINSLTSDQTSVSGKGEPGATVVIKNGSTQVASGIVAANGTYAITIPKQAYGSTVTATVTLNGQTSSASTLVTQGPSLKQPS